MASSTTESSATQERVLAFLADPALHPGVTRIDTHAASVFLDDKRAQDQRAVRFPFLDYSTLEKRKGGLRGGDPDQPPLAPQIYRGVVAITEDRGGALRIGGDGTAIEYAVEMSRFDENRTLDHLAAAGPIGPEIAADIADAISASHATAPRVGVRWSDAVSALIDGETPGELRQRDHIAAMEIEAPR